MKKTLLAAIGAALAFASPASAGPADTLNGPYLGAEAGGSVSGTTVETEAGSYDLYGQGAAGGIFAGYGMTFGNFYVGGEVNGTFGSLKSEDLGASIEKDYGYGLAARGGYLLGSGTLGYGVIGWERARFDLKDEVSSSKEWVDGLRLGAGIEQAVSDTVTARGELNFIKWQGKDFGVDNIDAHEINAKVGLSYRFN